MRGGRGPILETNFSPSEKALRHLCHLCLIPPKGFPPLSHGLFGWREPALPEFTEDPFWFFRNFWS